MNLVLLEPDELPEGAGRVRLVGRRYAHVRDVHRARVGDSLRVGVVGGRVGRGIVVAVGDDAVELDVSLEGGPPASLAALLVLALPRPKALRRTLVAIASLGVKQVALVQTARVEPSYWRSPLLSPEVVREALVLGLEQARDTVLPTVTLHRRFRPFVEDELPALARGARRLVADPAAAMRCPSAVAEPIALAVGPDGGFVPFEVDLLAAQGFEPVSLGPRALRVEHAVPALLGRLSP